MPICGCVGLAEIYSSKLRATNANIIHSLLASNDFIRAHVSWALRFVFELWIIQANIYYALRAHIIILLPRVIFLFRVLNSLMHWFLNYASAEYFAVRNGGASRFLHKKQR